MDLWQPKRAGEEGALVPLCLPNKGVIGVHSISRSSLLSKTEEDNVTLESRQMKP